MNSTAHTSELMDQAAGLRNLFVRKQVRFVPVVANPYVARSSVMMEQLCHAIGNMDLRALVVDASRTAGASAYQPQRRSRLAAERLAPGLGYLDVSDMAVQDAVPAAPAAQQPAQAFLHEVASTMPDADVVLVHAAAPDLLHLFSRHRDGGNAPRFVLLCDERPPAVTSAYAALKLLATRGGMMAHNLLLSSLRGARVAVALSAHLARCAHQFLGALQHHAAWVDPACPDSDANLPAMHRLTEDLLSRAWVLESPGKTTAAVATPGQPSRARFF